MPLPNLPEQGSTAWFTWAQNLHTLVAEIDSGRLTDAALRGALGAVPWIANEVVTAGAFRLSPTGQIIQRNSNGTTRSAYDSTEQALWTVAAGGTPADATSAAKGIVELATTTEAAAGSDTTRAVTPAGARRSFARRPQFVSAYQGIATDFAVNQNQTMSFRHSHKLCTDVADVRLIVPIGAKLTNTQTAADVLAPAAVPLKASLTIGGVARPVTFRQGVRSISNDPSGIPLSDPITADLASGTVVPVWTAHAVTGNLPYPNAIGTGQGPGFSTTGDGFTSGSDATDGTGNASASNASQWTPHGLVGIPAAPLPAFAGIGDSITLGTGDTANNGGYLARATNAVYPLLRLTVGGGSAQGVVAQHSYTWPLLEFCTHAVVLFGANDLTPGNARTAAQLQADLTTLYTLLRRRGLKVYGCTILPRTLSSSDMTPIGSNFAAGSSSGRGVVNAWIRGGAGGLLDGYFETADAVETGRDTGVWAASMTSDGAHPSTAGHTAMAANLNLSALATAHAA